MNIRLLTCCHTSLNANYIIELRPIKPVRKGNVCDTQRLLSHVDSGGVTSDWFSCTHNSIILSRQRLRGTRVYCAAVTLNVLGDSMQSVSHYPGFAASWFVYRCKCPPFVSRYVIVPEAVYRCLSLFCDHAPGRRDNFFTEATVTLKHGWQDAGVVLKLFYHFICTFTASVARSAVIMTSRRLLHRPRQQC